MRAAPRRFSTSSKEILDRYRVAAETRAHFEHEAINGSDAQRFVNRIDADSPVRGSSPAAAIPSCNDATRAARPTGLRDISLQRLNVQNPHAPAQLLLPDYRPLQYFGYHVAGIAVGLTRDLLQFRRGFVRKRIAEIGQ